MKILITGGLGFIGSHLAKRLVNEGHKVSIVDNLFFGDRRNVNNVKGIKLDIKDLREYENCFAVTRNVDWVFHLAANMGGIGYITRVGADVMRDNLRMNINMLEASVKNRVKRFLYTSSACIYPVRIQASPHVKPLKESDAIPAEPNEAYGWEKLTTEILCEMYQRDYGLDVRIARLHGVFGEGYTSFDPDKGKAPCHLILKALKYPKEKFTVWGDGKQTRSFLYIDDCVEGLIKLMESNYNKPLNIGSDRLVTINELVAIISKVSGKKFNVEYDLSKPQGVRGRNADLTLVERILGWKPEISLEEGIKRTYLWAEKNLSQIVPMEK